MSVTPNEQGAVEVDAEAAADALFDRWNGADDATEDTTPAEEAEAVTAEDEQPEVEDSDDAEPDDQEAETEEDEGLSFESVDELAEALGMPTDELLASIKAKAKISGEEMEVTLAELRNGYQREADYTRKTQELAEQRKAFEQQATQAQQEIQARLTQLNELTQQAESALLAEYNSVNWQELRVTDPAEYAARQQDFAARSAELQQTKQQAIQQAQYEQAMQQQQQAQVLAQQLQAEQQALVQKMPDWNDDVKNELVGYLKEQGFGEEQIGQVYDHKLILMARKAMQFDAQAKRGKETAKKVKNLPPVLKPGAKSRNTKADRIKSLQQKLKKTGSSKVAEELLFDRLS